MKKYILVIISCLVILPSLAQTPDSTQTFKWDISAGNHINTIGTPKSQMQAVSVGYNVMKGWNLGINLGYMQGGAINHPPVHGFLATAGIAAENMSTSSGFSLIPAFGLGLYQSWGKDVTSKASFVSDMSMSLRYMITPTFYSAIETRAIIPNRNPREMVAIFLGIRIGIRL